MSRRTPANVVHSLSDVGQPTETSPRADYQAKRVSLSFAAKAVLVMVVFVGACLVSWSWGRRWTEAGTLAQYEGGEEGTSLRGEIGAMFQSAGSLAAVAVNSVIVFGVALIYLPQYLQTRRTGNAEGFTLLVPLILLASNILRIFYWFGERFALPLLGQALVTVIVMLLMLEQTVRYRRIAAATRAHRHIMDMNCAHFWNWDGMTSFVIATMLYVSAVSIITAVAVQSKFMVNVMGYLALGVEALLPVPQYLRNKRRSSTQGLSTLMVLSWFVGDLLKTMYFKLTKAPTPFLCCGVVQCSVDILVLNQIRIYRAPSKINPHVYHATATTDPPL
eukprot:c16163_g1_i1.p1 GENE.c16163_g1_i1~~c16163_g1_i1.p1  ORF type:complete len:333 (+),score=41.40 c16163_g1_i1:82-1080(+)